MIRLLIDNKQLDLTDDLSIKMTYNSVDTSSPTAIKNNFSKTISVPGTPNNNEIFGQIYRFDRTLESSSALTGVSFDARKRVPFTLLKNGAIIESGYMQLNSIDVQNQNITYNITLYGGLGGFFYNLMYNSDGEERTLADLYYKWKPIFSFPISFPPPVELTPEQEATSNIISWSAKVIGNGFAHLGPWDSSDEATYITNDVTIIPVLNGKYKDFKSDTMLINTKGFQAPYLVGDDCVADLTNFYPTSISADGQTFQTVDDPNTDSSWGLVKFQRDLEPFEARDIRVSQMPIGLKLSKLMNVISNPYNNGGYTVVWDQDIKDSPYWKYSWLMLGKPDYEKQEYTDHTFSFTSLPYRIVFSNPPADTTSYVNPMLNVNFDVQFDVQYWFPPTADHWERTVINDGWRASLTFSNEFETRPYVAPTHFYFSTLVVTVTDDSDPEDVKSVAYLYYNNQYEPDSPLGTYHGHFCVSPADMTQQIYDKLCTLPDYPGTRISQIIKKELQLAYNTSYYYGWVTGDAVQLQYGWKIPIEIDIAASKVTNYQPIIQCWPVQYIYDLNNDTYEIEINPTVFSGLWRFFYSPMWDYFTTGTHLISEKTNDAFNGIYENGTTPTTRLFANKQVLLGNTDSPYKYLTDFTKLLNLKYEYDPITKHIKISTLKNYYQPEIVDLNKQIDISKKTNIKTSLIDSKYIEYSIQTPDTYNNHLYSKLNKKPYSSHTFDTGSEFNAETTKFVEESIFREIIPYQLTSQYVTNSWIFAQEPVPIMAGTFEWKLYKNANVNEDTHSVTKNNLNVTSTSILSLDWLNKERTSNVPYLCCFDTDQEFVDECKNSFVFLNGFQRNFNYITREVDADNIYSTAQALFILTDDSDFTKQFNSGSNCYLYSASYGGPLIDQVLQEGDVKTSFGWSSPYSWAPWHFPYFSKIHSMKYLPDQDWWEPDEQLVSWHMYKPTVQLYNESKVRIQKYMKPLPWNYKQIPETPEIIAWRQRISSYYTLQDWQNNNNIYIYNKYWKDYIEDMYDANTKQVTLYARLDDEPTNALKKFYDFGGSRWIITKIEDLDILSDYRNEFYKVTFVKIKNMINYTNIN